MPSYLQSLREKLSSRSKSQKILDGILVVLLVAVLLLVCLRQTPAARLSRQLELGQRYLNELDYEAAVLHFTNAIRIDDRSEPAYLGRAEAYLGLEEYQLAVDDYTVVIEQLNPESADAYAGRAQAYTGLGDREHAAADAARAAELGHTGQTPAATAAPTDAPLTAADLQWTVEPTYDYAQVIPLRGSSFSDIEGAFGNSTDAVIPGSPFFYELSFPGYSNLPQYYAVQSTDGNWRAYYMPDHTDSGDIPMDSPENSTHPYRFDATGIINYTVTGDLGMIPTLPSPWYVFTILERGAGEMEMYYDTFAQKGMAVGFFYAVYAAPTELCNLHKPYPCAAISSEGRNIDTANPVLVELDDPNGEETWDLYSAYTTVDANAPKAYVGTDGQLITDFSYDMAEDFSEGLAACRKDGKWGYIDETGQPVTDFVYDGVWYNSGYNPDAGEYGAYETLDPTGYPCTSDTMVVCQNGQYGLLYRDGTLLIGFGELEAMAPAYNDELWAKQNGLWGLVDLAAVKEKRGIAPTLSVSAAAEVPDPPVSNVEQVTEFQTGDVLIDYPTTRSEEALVPTGYFTTTADSGLVMRTGPGTDYPRKNSIPVGSSVTVWGALRSTPGWVYVSWYDRQTMQAVYGWVSQEYLE